MPRREPSQPNKGSKRYVGHDADGEFTIAQVDVGKSSAADQGPRSATAAKQGQHDGGDRPDLDAAPDGRRRRSDRAEI
jgi:hypothetical protein